MRPPQPTTTQETMMELLLDGYYKLTPDEALKITVLLKVPATLGLDFDDEALWWLGHAAKRYFHVERGGDRPVPRASEVKTALRKIKKTSQRLAKTLTQSGAYCHYWMNREFRRVRNSERALSKKPPLQTPAGYPYMQDLTDDLLTTIKAADYWLEHGAPDLATPGRPKQEALPSLVGHLLGVWKRAGRTDSYTNKGNTYSGPLFDFVDACLKALGLYYANTTIGDMIKAERKR